LHRLPRSESTETNDHAPDRPSQAFGCAQIAGVLARYSRLHSRSRRGWR
jgi:hypothetical protein